MYKNKKLKNSMHEALDLALLENDIEAMTKEYLLLGREIQNTTHYTIVVCYVFYHNGSGKSIDYQNKCLQFLESFVEYLLCIH